MNTKIQVLVAAAVVASLVALGVAMGLHRASEARPAIAPATQSVDPRGSSVPDPGEAPAIREASDVVVPPGPWADVCSVAVVDAASSMPLANAVVRLPSSPSGKEVRTDGAGRCKVDLGPDASAMVCVSARLYTHRWVIASKGAEVVVPLRRAAVVRVEAIACAGLEPGRAWVRHRLGGAVAEPWSLARMEGHVAEVTADPGSLVDLELVVDGDAVATRAVEVDEDIEYVHFEIGLDSRGHVHCDVVDWRTEQPVANARLRYRRSGQPAAVVGIARFEVRGALGADVPVELSADGMAWRWAVVKIPSSGSGTTTIRMEEGVTASGEVAPEAAPCAEVLWGYEDDSPAAYRRTTVAEGRFVVEGLRASRPVVLIGVSATGWILRDRRVSGPSGACEWRDVFGRGRAVGIEASPPATGEDQAAPVEWTLSFRDKALGPPLGGTVISSSERRIRLPWVSPGHIAVEARVGGRLLHRDDVEVQEGAGEIRWTLDSADRVDVSLVLLGCEDGAEVRGRLRIVELVGVDERSSWTEVVTDARARLVGLRADRTYRVEALLGAEVAGRVERFVGQATFRADTAESVEIAVRRIGG